MSEDRELASYFTPRQAADLLAALADSRCRNAPLAYSALTEDGRVDLLTNVTIWPEGVGEMRVESWLGLARYPSRVTVNKLLSHFRERLELNIECYPGECLFRGADGGYYALRCSAGAGEQSVAYVREQIEEEIRQARNNDYARVKAMRGHIAVLESRGRTHGETEWLRPAARPFYFTRAEAVAVRNFLGFSRVNWARGGPLASARAKLARALPAGDDLVLEWACGHGTRIEGAVTAGQFTEHIRQSVGQHWRGVNRAVFVAEDGGFYSPEAYIDVAQACPVYARGLVAGELLLAREKGDDARVDALKGHLEALDALVAGEKQASGDEVAVGASA